MSDLLSKLSICIERGKISAESLHPADMQGSDGAVELTKSALQNNLSPKEILNEGMLSGMKRVGDKFREGKIFIPEVLISAKALNAAMELLKPYFVSGEIKHKGKVIIATVSGDLHDIGKNILKMVLEGGGWQVIDLGTNTGQDKFVDAIRVHSAKIVGMSALLTTTMQNMKPIIDKIRQEFNDVFIAIGGAPLNTEFAKKINADAYFPDPQGMLDFINNKYSAD